MTAARQSGEGRSAAALAAAGIFALEPRLFGGIRLMGPACRYREAWRARLARCLLPDAPLLHVTPSTDPDRLLGGVDVMATLAAGHVARQPGILDRAAGGIVELRSAECIDQRTAGILALALDGDGAGAGVGLVALDESCDDTPGLPAILAERLGLWLDAGWLGDQGADAGPVPDMTTARLQLPLVEVPDDVAIALARAAEALGVRSDRALIHAVRATRAAAALAWRVSASAQDAEIAALLVLAPRATRMPPVGEQAGEDEAQPPEADPPEADEARPDIDPQTCTQAAERIVDAVRAALPGDVLDQLESAGLPGRRGTEGSGRRLKADQEARRGRQIGSRPGDPRRGKALDLMATMQAAVPWQRLRAGPAGAGLSFRAADLRVRRHRQQRGRTTIFCVDASGSTALERLAEAKGAVEQLLAGCYVRRDEVALVAFRDRAAEIVVPPTRSLQRARACLASLPGGGGTPLAEGIAAASRIACETTLRGRTPALVLITDGRPNVGFGGTVGRQAAAADALAAARDVGHRRFSAMVIDSSPRPEPQARAIADAMGARYLALPHADAAMLHAAIRGQADAGPARRP